MHREMQDLAVQHLGFAREYQEARDSEQSSVYDSARAVASGARR